MAQGRGLQYSDMATRAKVCVIGAYLNQAYFGGNAVGQTLRVGGQSLTVVGVLAQQDEDLEEGGSDDCLYLPYTTASRISGEVSSYVITMKDENYIDESVAALEAALYAVFASDDYYTVTSMAEMLETMTSMINILVGVLAGIAAISLVVGGIGIMNIMLVSVTERTREIGIRKSLGAKERYIMQQFVIEAAATSALGGIIGILLGDGCLWWPPPSWTRLMEESLTVSPTLAAVALAFGISVGIGILFGYLPAKKAASSTPSTRCTTTDLSRPGRAGPLRNCECSYERQAPRPAPGPVPGCPGPARRERSESTAWRPSGPWASSPGTRAET